MKNVPASRRRRVVLAAIVVAVAGCSKQPPAQAPASAPLVTVNPAAAAAAADVYAGEVAAAGIPATYRATFVDNQLKRIAETRKTGAASPPSGDYEFYGARLLKYSGAPLQGETPIELEFDMRGAVVKARAGANEAPAEEISAIRERAQLLRSHALAQRSVRGHGVR